MDHFTACMHCSHRESSSFNIERVMLRSNTSMTFQHYGFSHIFMMLMKILFARSF